MAAYTQCLRCAGAPRRPAGGSGLSLSIPSWHAALSDPGEFGHRMSRTSMPTSPSPRSEQLGTPDPPAIRFTRGTSFGASWFTHLLRPVRLLAPLYGSDWNTQPPGGSYFQASNGSVALPVAGYDYNSDWTPLLAGLSPAGMAASLAAPDPYVQLSRIRLLPRVMTANVCPMRSSACDTLARSASGTCFAGSHSPWCPPFAPPASSIQFAHPLRTV